MGGDRLAGPDGADFSSGVVAYGEDEVQYPVRLARRIRPSFFCVDHRGVVSLLDQLDGKWIDFAGGMAAGAEGFELAFSLGVEYGFRQNAACGIASAEEDDVFN